MHKILRFGLLGAIGCLIGAAVGEALWHLGTSNADGQPSDVGRTLFSNDLSERLAKAGARTGQVQVSLAWNNTNDLDLHCVDPSGEEVFFNHRRCASGGEMDIDMNSRSPYSSHPVENVYWPSEKAPPGRYRVVVNYFASHGASDPTDFVCGWIVNGEKTEKRGSISADDGAKTIGEFAIAAAHRTFTGQGHWTAAIWTGLLAVGFSLALLIGQNAYLGRSKPSRRQVLFVSVGAFVAGVAAGGAANLAFEALACQAQVASVGRVIGWILLGAMLGGGMSVFVPNLPRVRASLAGAVGGLVGAAAFECLTRLLGSLPARWAGAAILGFCLGLMVAVVEALCREAWIEVIYGPKEIKTFSLGKRPITVGSGAECVVFVGAASAVALRFFLEDGHIRCSRDGAAPRTVLPGHEEVLGSVRVVVQGQSGPGCREK